MKKLFFLTFLLTLLLPISKIHAESVPEDVYDYLSGKPFVIANSTIENLSFTDNNNTTGTQMYNHYTISFENPIDISGYSSYSVGGIYGAGVAIIFNYDNGMSNTTVAGGSGGYTTLNLKGVKKITLARTGTEGSPGFLYDLKVFVKKTPTPVLNPTLDVTIEKEKVGVGQEFTAGITLKNVKDIYAEDFEIKYDNQHLQYLGFEEVAGYKVYNTPTDLNGTLRFIVASKGEDYGINKDTVILKLKFKAKAIGTAVVDSTKARIADTEQEYDLEKENCLEDSIIIEATDVNKSGEFTLVDLAIDARYFKYLAADVDPVKYNAQQAGDEYVNDDDLLYIVDQILSNPNYLPNS
ncbi:cohesin domain-containing protein [Paenibacillus sp. FSL H7-0716]|uniref:Cohesin domain-containing protein n=1 Tax=Paenibacillus odorifer TaxID=189426 RepID=A0AB36JEI0_9BACL|nr:cohesin domain-containing protein [Paenibacillus odorifer]OME18381.1 hypothetical protein BSK47_17315 [Paenibacillus odorifer]OME41452.1 hypothetical protein BSK58_15085 [Paenibacillus odorifer]